MSVPSSHPMLLLFILLLGLPNELPNSLSDDTQLIAGLRERRLFELAETYCQRKLAQPNLSQTDAATLTIELIKTQTANAILSQEPDRQSSWEKAFQTTTTFLDHHRGHPRALLIRVQRALTHLARGLALQQEIEAEIATAPDREVALEELRRADSQLNEIQREIERMIPQQRNRTLSEHELTSEELLILNNQIRLQLATTNIKRAQLFSADDRLNRIDVLNNVLGWLRDVQRESAPHQVTWWESQAILVECFRLLQRYNEALMVDVQIKELVEDQPNLANDPWLEQQLLLALDLKDEELALLNLRRAESVANRSPNLELARLRVAMDFSTRSVEPGKEEWLNRAALLARNIEAQHGSYWGRRAKLILIDHRTNSDHAAATHENSPGNASSAELDLLTGLAEQAERQGRFDDAVKAYDRAASIATELNAAPQAFSFSVRAAQTLEKQQRHREAANRLIQLANSNREYEFASAAHLRGCWNWGRLLLPTSSPSADETDPAHQTRFMELLKEHLQHWPNADSANQVKVWLGNQYQVQTKAQPQTKAASQWKDAFEIYASVSPTSPLFANAITNAGICAKQWINASEQAQQQANSMIAVQRLQQVLSSCPNNDLVSQYQVVLVLVEIAVRFSDMDPSRWIKWLNQLADDDFAIPSDRKRSKAMLYSILAFDAASNSTAQKLLAEFADDKTLLVLADQGIAAILSRRKNPVDNSSSQLRLDLIETALSKHSDSMETSERTAWMYRRGDTLIGLGKTSEALNVLNELEQQLPNDAGVKLRIARLLTQTEADATKPLAQWRRLAAQLKPQTDGWYEAKFNVALLLEKTGEREEARKMLEYLKAVPPGWENSKLRNEFESLLLRLK